MIKSRYDFENNYLVTFNDCDGEYFRTNVFDENGDDTGQEPFMGDFPHLLDIGIKGHCEHGLSGRCLEAGTYCYQRGDDHMDTDMSLKDYVSIMVQCRDKVFQVALGGRGDADCHKDFEPILFETRKYGIVPNITTSGFMFNREKAKITAKYCGAGAVSWYRNDYTYRAIDLMLEEGVTTNIHYILSEQSIKEAVELLEKDGFPKGVRAVVFLLYKPVGYDKPELLLRPDNKYLNPFFELMNADGQHHMLGFDSCMVSGVVNNCKSAAPECIEPCESGRFSAYINYDMMMYPCSFVQKSAYAGDLMKDSLKKIWMSKSFERFRETQRNACLSCKDRILCLGGCPEIQSINLCERFRREMQE